MMIAGIMNNVKKCVLFWKNMEAKKKVIVLSISILILNLLGSFFTTTKLWHYYFYPYFYTIGREIIFAIIYIILQMFLLYYAIKLQNKLIYFFPFHWGMEIWRILYKCVNIITYQNMANDVSKFIFLYLLAPFWGADWFPFAGPYKFEIEKKGFLFDIMYEDAIKLTLSFIMFIVSIIFSWKQYHRDNNSKKGFQLHK